MDRTNLARTSTYSPTLPESGVFAAVARATPVGAHAKIASDARKEDSPIGDEHPARLALYEALCVLANAAARLSQGGVR